MHDHGQSSDVRAVAGREALNHDDRIRRYPHATTVHTHIVPTNLPSHNLLLDVWLIEDPDEIPSTTAPDFEDAVTTSVRN
jgi:hypothetical protein